MILMGFNMIVIAFNMIGFQDDHHHVHDADHDVDNDADHDELPSKS